MEISSKLLDAFQTLSKIALSLLIGITGLSVYIIQKAVSIAIYGTDAFSTETQIEQWGLKFSYLTLTFVLPLILGVLCLMFRHAVLKQLDVWEHVRFEVKDITPQVFLALDPFLLARYGKKLPAEDFALRFLSLFPIIALIAHVTSQALAVYRYSIAHKDPSSWLLILSNVGLQFIAIGISSLWVRLFSQALNEAISMFTVQD